MPVYKLAMTPVGRVIVGCHKFSIWLPFATRESIILFTCGRAEYPNCCPLKPKDITSDAGLTKHLTTVMRIKPHGLLWSAQECTTLIWAGRAGTGRSKDFPAGDIRQPTVAAANKQVIALVVCLLVAWLRDVRTGAENPSSTLLHLLRPFDLWLKFVCKGSSAIRTHLGAFGCSSPKPLHLWGDWIGLQKLRRTCPIEDVDDRLMARSGAWTNGKAKDMKASSEYTPEFGQAVAKLVANPAPSVKDVLCGSSSTSTSSTSCNEMPTWEQVKHAIDEMMNSVVNYGALEIFNIGLEMQNDQLGYIKNSRFLPTGVTNDATDVATDGAEGEHDAPVPALLFTPPKRRRLSSKQTPEGVRSDAVRDRDSLGGTP